MNVIMNIEYRHTCSASKIVLCHKGPIKYYVTQMGVGVSGFREKKCYESVMFNVISVTRGWVRVQFSEK